MITWAREIEFVVRLNFEESVVTIEDLETIYPRWVCLMIDWI